MAIAFMRLCFARKGEISPMFTPAKVHVNHNETTVEEAKNNGLHFSAPYAGGNYLPHDANLAACCGKGID